MNVGFSEPWHLAFGLLALLPLVRSGQRATLYSSLARLPQDPLSNWLEWLWRIAAMLAIAGLTIAAAGPHSRESWIERTGTGARIVLLVDRSSSMNENFSGAYLGGKSDQTKSAVASRLLSEFIARRHDDLFALVVFSAAPIYVLPFTQDRDAVLAAVASLRSRGHGITHIAPGLAMALENFEGVETEGSRAIVLLSDGAARMDDETRDAIRQQFRDRGAALYWIYLRNPKSPRLDMAPTHANESTTPEYFLHGYFQELGIPYRAYEADKPDDVAAAIADIERLENHPLSYRERVPREDLSAYGFGIAGLGLAVLIGFRLLEPRG